MSTNLKRSLMVGGGIAVVVACLVAFYKILMELPPADDNIEDTEGFEEALHLLTGGYTAADYEAAKMNTVSQIEVAREFHATYPDAIEYIGAFTGNDRSVTKWNASTLIYGRYELTLQIPIEYNRAHREVVYHGVPQFHLDEIIKVERTSGGGLRMDYGDADENFGAEKWEEIFQAKGRIEKVFDGVRTDAPAKDVEFYIEYYKGREP